MAERNEKYFQGLGAFRGLSSSVLKLIAITAMLCDHASVILIGSDATILRAFGRIAFPIFAFMISEGAVRSGNIPKYIKRLLAFALISEIPFDIAFGNNFIDFSKQNVYFTLLLGLVSILVIKKLKEKRLGFLGILTTPVFGFLAFFLRTDYAFMGVVVITLYYAFAEQRGLLRVLMFSLTAFMTCFMVTPITVFFVSVQAFAVFSVIPIILYNGGKGFRMNKYAFYAFYPVHLIILTFIARL